MRRSKARLVSQLIGLTIAPPQAVFRSGGLLIGHCVLVRGCLIWAYEEAQPNPCVSCRRAPITSCMEAFYTGKMTCESEDLLAPLHRVRLNPSFLYRLKLTRAVNAVHSQPSNVNR